MVSTQKHGIYCKIGTPKVSSVHLGQHVSSPFRLGRGVQQGSVFSPALFLLVIDPLLRELQSLSIGALVNNMYVGGFLHADDIRTLAPTVTTLEAQISIIKRFTEENFLKLNTSNGKVVEIVYCKKSRY